MDTEQIEAARKLAADSRGPYPENFNWQVYLKGLADLVDQLADELDLVLKTTRTGELRTMVAAAEAENMRLRAALTKIAEPEKYWGGDYMRRIARATLNPEAGSSE